MIKAAMQNLLFCLRHPGLAPGSPAVGRTCQNGFDGRKEVPGQARDDKRFNRLNSADYSWDLTARADGVAYAV